MILATRFNGTQIYINAELIQFVEPTPDTIITLTTNAKILVKEPPELIIERIINYRRSVNRGELTTEKEKERWTWRPSSD